MRKVLIISHAFLPQYGMGPLRIGKLAKYLPDFDYLPLILAGGNGKNDASWVFRPPLPNVVAWGKRLLRQTAQTKAGGEKAGSNYRPPMQEVKGWWPPSEVRMPDKYLYWIVPAVGLGLRIIKRHHPDLIFSSSGPPSSAIVASILQKLSALPWVAEFRDLWTRNPYDVRTPRLHRLDAWLEARVLKNAASLVSISEPLARQLAADHGNPACVVYNGYDEDDYPATASMGEIFTITYAGMIMPGKRDPSVLFQAVKLLSDRNWISPATFKVRFYGPQMEEEVRPIADRFGVRQFCELSGPIPHRECLKRQCESSLLLLLEWNDQRARGTVTGKIFEYLGAGRPILCLGYPHGALAQVLGVTGGGVILNDSAKITAYLLDQIEAWRRQPPGIKEVKRPLSVSRFSRWAAAQEMSRIFDQALRG
jgi:hypothetical protein